MKKLVLALLVLCVFNCFILIRCLEKRATPWFIHRNGIYYIDTKPDFTSKQARDICVQKNMMFTMSMLDIKEILEYITSVYGYHPAFWTYDNEKNGYLMASKLLPHVTPTGLIDDTCYKLNTRDSQYLKEDCNDKQSFLCKRNFVGASLYFVNGTHREIDRTDVATYCNPQSQEFDDVLELCLIRYFKVTPKLYAAR